METKGALILVLCLSFSSFFVSSVNSLSDSCSSKLNVGNLLPFNLSSSHCISAWSSEGFILRYVKSGPSKWSFVLSAPDTNSYIAIGSSVDGRMVGSTAIAGWITGSGPGKVKQYYLGGMAPSECPPDQGTIKNSAILSKSSTLYLAFELENTTTPQPYTIYAVGPKNELPSNTDFLLPEHRDMSSAPVKYDTGAADNAKKGGADGATENGKGGSHSGKETSGSGDIARRHANVAKNFSITFMCSLVLSGLFF